jgi:hypothetical protein
MKFNYMKKVALGIGHVSHVESLHLECFTFKCPFAGRRMNFAKAVLHSSFVTVA